MTRCCGQVSQESLCEFFCNRALHIAFKALWSQIKDELIEKTNEKTLPLLILAFDEIEYLSNEVGKV